jgi:beta-aspartyl-peptidase (threonine type)
MQVLAHGGAGGPADEPADRQAALDDAVAAGTDASTPQEAVVATVKALESHPAFNAGVGSAVQSDGRIRTDAGLMRSDGTTGAASAMPDVEHAVSVATVVATETPHVLVSGSQAVDLASAFGIETNCDLWTDRTRERWEEVDPPDGDARAHLAWVHEQFGGTDTVGAVASDGTTLAAATSTGGRWCALAGRVGDVPQIGAGFYATERAAASATGAGEAIARYGLARRVVELVESGHGPQQAADRAIHDFDRTTDATAGVIALDVEGRAGSAYNSAAMQTAER